MRETMSLITNTDVKSELGISDTTDDAFITTLCNAILSIWDEETGRTWAYTANTEYYNSEGHSSIVILDNYPVDSSATFELYDDPDWDWSASDLVDSDDYRVDYDEGIVYYDGYFYEGKQTIKVIYSAGYTDLTVPSGIKQILVRQTAHWFQQAKAKDWDKATVSSPAGGGTINYKNLKDNFLPEFAMAIEKNKKRKEA